MRFRGLKTKFNLKIGTAFQRFSKENNQIVFAKDLNNLQDDNDDDEDSHDCVIMGIGGHGIKCKDL